MFKEEIISNLYKVFQKTEQERSTTLILKSDQDNIYRSVSQSVSCPVMSDSLQPHGLQHARLPCPSPTPGACSNSCPLRWWCHTTISPSVVPFSSFNLSQHQGLLQWVSRLHQVAKMNIQDWFILIAFINTFTININKTLQNRFQQYIKR